MNHNKVMIDLPVKKSNSIHIGLMEEQEEMKKEIDYLDEYLCKLNLFSFPQEAQCRQRKSQWM